jgi:putative ABC transport system permease protein
MTNLVRDLVFGFRLLGKNLGFTSVALLALTLGIGANTAIFSVVYATLLSPMPYPNPDQLVMVWAKVNGNRNGVSAGDFLDWKNQNKLFQDMIAWTGGSFSLSTGGHPEQIQARTTSPGSNDMLGVPFALGRDLLPEEGQVGRDHVVVMTHKLWVERFGSDAHIIGQQLRMNGEPYTVVGVLAAGQPDRLDTPLFVVRPEV